MREKVSSSAQPTTTPKDVSGLTTSILRNRHTLERSLPVFAVYFVSIDKSRENPYFVRGGSRLLSKFSEKPFVAACAVWIVRIHRTRHFLKITFIPSQALTQRVSRLGMVN